MSTNGPRDYPASFTDEQVAAAIGDRAKLERLLGMVVLLVRRLSKPVARQMRVDQDDIQSRVCSGWNIREVAGALTLVRPTRRSVNSEYKQVEVDALRDPARGYEPMKAAQLVGYLQLKVRVVGIDLWRAMNRETARRAKAEPPHPGGEDPGRRLESSDLAQAAARLRPEEREVLNLRFVRGLTQEQTADSLGVSVKKVKLLQAASLGSLRSNVALRA